jgi:hypothetical protein
VKRSRAEKMRQLEDRLEVQRKEREAREEAA